MNRITGFVLLSLLVAVSLPVGAVGEEMVLRSGAPATAVRSESMLLDLSDGLVRAHRTAVRERIALDGATVTTWRGVLEGDPESVVQLTTVDGVTAGHVKSKGRSWNVSPTEGLVPLDDEPFSCGTDESAGTPDLGRLAASAIVPPGPTKATAHIDVLVLYEPWAANVAGGDAAITAAIHAAVERCNTSLEGSKVKAVLNAVAEPLWDYTPASRGASPQLGYLAGHATAQSRREAYGADLVVAVVEQIDGYGGMAYSFGSFAPGQGHLPFALAQRYGLGSIFCHEVGHLLGAKHNREDNAQLGQPAGVPDIGYAYGRVIEPDYAFVTLMHQGAFRFGTSDGDNTGTFSNPDVLFRGYPTGTVEENNAMVLSYTVGTVASYGSSRFACEPSEHVLCIGPNGRFRVFVDWEASDGRYGEAFAGTLLGEDGGYFWFFDPNNPEVVVKIVDGCSINDRKWIYIAPVSDLRIVVTIEDPVTGEFKSIIKPLHLLSGFADTQTFDVCP